MSWNDIVYGIADLFQAAFSVLEALDGLPNKFFIVVGFIATGIWISQMLKHQKTNNP